MHSTLCKLLLCLAIGAGGGRVAFAGPTGDSAGTHHAARVGQWDAGGRGTISAVAVSGAMAVVYEGRYLKILDVSNATAPREISSVRLDERVTGIALEGSYAYIANGFEGLRILDLSVPAS